jgi:hypothetical protein
MEAKMAEIETKSAMKSKTVGINAGIMALYTVAKWVKPDLEIPQDVLVSGLSLANLILRLMTTKGIGG